MTTAYPPRTNGQPERFNNTSISKPWQYMAELQRNWNIYVQPFTPPYNAQGHRSTDLTPFSSIIFHYPPGSIRCNAPIVSSTDATETTSPHISGAQLVHREATNKQQASEPIMTAQRRCRGNHKKILAIKHKRSTMDNACTLAAHQWHLWCRETRYRFVQKINVPENWPIQNRHNPAKYSNLLMSMSN